MKNKHLIISFIIGIILFFPTSEVKAFDCYNKACKYIDYKYNRNGSPRSTVFSLSIKFYEEQGSEHTFVVECSGKTCNKKAFNVESTNGIADLPGDKPPVAICAHPGELVKNPVDIDGNPRKESNYKKYIYYSYEEIDNAIAKSYCAEDDIYYNVDSYPRYSVDGTLTSTNSCLEAAGLRCYYRNINDSEDIVEYGYTIKSQEDKLYNQFFIHGSDKVQNNISSEDVKQCSCPDYVSYNKTAKKGEPHFDTLDMFEYEKKKNNKNYIFYEISNSANVSKEEVNEDNILKDVTAEADPSYKYEGEVFCGIFGENTFGFIKSLYSVVKILIPVLIIVLGIIDFLKVVFSGEEKDMKASGTRFLKRIIAGIIFILLPALIEFLMSIVGFSEDCIQQLIK